MTTTTQSLTPTRLEDIESSSYVEHEVDEGKIRKRVLTRQEVEYEFPNGYFQYITLYWDDHMEPAIPPGVKLFVDSEVSPIATGPLTWIEITDALAQWMWETGHLENRVVDEIVLDQNKATVFWSLPRSPVAPSPSEFAGASREDRCPCCGRIPEPVFEDWTEVRTLLA